MDRRTHCWILWTTLSVNYVDMAMVRSYWIYHCIIVSVRDHQLTSLAFDHFSLTCAAVCLNPAYDNIILPIYDLYC